MNMRAQSGELSGANAEIEIYLDGIPIQPPSDYRSLGALRLFLETKAMEQQRVMCALSIDGHVINLAKPFKYSGAFSRVEAETAALEDHELVVLKTALQQASYARECIETAMTLVLINDIKIVKELWWDLALQLKQPIVTLSLLPEDMAGSVQVGVPMSKLRKWQLEQAASIIREVDLACSTGDTVMVSDALEKRVLPWLCRMQDLISLWLETVMAATRLGIRNREY